MGKVKNDTIAIGIDTGWSSLGWAIIAADSEKPRQRKFEIVGWGTTRRWSKNDNTWGTTRGLLYDVIDAVRNHDKHAGWGWAQHRVAAIECPEPRSIVAAASGSLIQLALVAGAAMEQLHYAAEVKARLVTPREWKGSLSKDMTWQRCLQAVQFAKGVPLRSSEHARDAVGLALNVLGVSMTDWRMKKGRGR